MRIWVTGSGGMLGGHVLHAAEAAGHEAIGTLHDTCPIEDLAAVFSAVSSIHPDAIINCAGRLPGSDPIEMVVANAVGPHVLAATKVRLVHMSTDCVFSGSRAHGGMMTSYSSTALPDPCDFYGRSKLAGELDYPHTLTVRGSFIGKEGGFLAWLLNAKGPIAAWKNAYWNGGTVRAMAKWLVALAEGDRTGVVHVAAPGHTTKASMIKHLVETLDLEVTSVRYVDEPRSFRVLEPDFELPDLSVALREIVQEIKGGTIA